MKTASPKNGQKMSVDENGAMYSHKGVIMGRATADKNLRCGLCLKGTNRCFVWRHTLAPDFLHSAICDDCWDGILKIPSRNPMEIDVSKIRIVES